MSRWQAFWQRPAVQAGVAALLAGPLPYLWWLHRRGWAWQAAGYRALLPFAGMCGAALLLPSPWADRLAVGFMLAYAGVAAALAHRPRPVPADDDQLGAETAAPTAAPPGWDGLLLACVLASGVNAVALAVFAWLAYRFTRG